MIRYVTLSDVLFLGGKNHGVKVSNGGDTYIEHDKENDHVKITYKGETATIKHYASIIEGAEVAKKVQAPGAARPAKAQVSDPTAHAFAGPGKGQ